MTCIEEGRGRYLRIAYKLVDGISILPDGQIDTIYPNLLLNSKCGKYLFLESFLCFPRIVTGLRDFKKLRKCAGAILDYVFLQLR